MIAAAVPSTPSVLRGELDQSMADLAERNVRSTTINILAAALDRGLPEDFAVVIADAAEWKEPTS